MKALVAPGYGAVDQLRVSDAPERPPASVVDLINAGPELASTAALVRQGGRLISTLYARGKIVITF
ncbi:hypothetical protein ACFOY2_43675 [Nonomuraea purpurea]|uniref:Uncharacterized protein n=1 Tax=Nonomuraea purpurea TaxID=1849276 RepID=A0ABV8GJR5_9ACTN